MLAFILGAADPEMAEIEAVIKRKGHVALYAAKEGRRVHPGNAYKADGVTGGALGSNPVHLVECQVERIDTTALDHHRPGDPGYGRAPAEFMEASSLGQVLAVLGLQPTPQQRIIAAADHCLAAAYAGQCPGVDPNRLMEWRAANRAEFQGRPVREVIADVKRARAALKRADFVQYGGVEVASMGDRAIPELPEAAAREGIPFLAVVWDRDGRRKIVLQAAPPAAVEDFMAIRRKEGCEVYGDPARGFAGAYID